MGGNKMKHAVLGVADYTIMAPANPGGGWDGTARAMQEVMQAEGIAPSVR
jgi:putative tricarboxylic transport membrane protein